LLFNSTEVASHESTNYLRRRCGDGGFSGQLLGLEQEQRKFGRKQQWNWRLRRRHSGLVDRQELPYLVLGLSRWRRSV
jgi:hypothetical protein